MKGKGYKLQEREASGVLALSLDWVGDLQPVNELLPSLAPRFPVWKAWMLTNTIMTASAVSPGVACSLRFIWEGGRDIKQ